jgi:hypothetical protein
MTTDLNLSDIETCYKVFRAEVLKQIDLKSDRFGFEPEVTAKVARLGCRVYEVPISYYGRTYAEGKKIGWRDGVNALGCIVRFGLLARFGSRDRSVVESEKPGTEAHAEAEAGQRVRRFSNK